MKTVVQCANAKMIDNILYIPNLLVNISLLLWPLGAVSCFFHLTFMQSALLVCIARVSHYFLDLMSVPY